MKVHPENWFEAAHTEFRFLLAAARGARRLLDEPRKDAAYIERVACPPLVVATVPPPCCGGHGAQARADGQRYDGAGPHFPCPDCGARASDAWDRLDIELDLWETDETPHPGFSGAAFAVSL